MSKKTKIAVFASGEGTHFSSIVQACNTDKIDAEVQLLIVNKDCPAVNRAKHLKIPYVILNPSKFKDFSRWDESVLNHLAEYKINFILLAGFIKKIGPKVVLNFKNMILNIHPALLPKHGGQGMYGLNVHKAVLLAGDKITGSTVHKVNAKYDDGDIIDQITVAVKDNDTPESLCNRVKAVENNFYIQIIQQYLKKNSVN